MKINARLTLSIITFAVTIYFPKALCGQENFHQLLPSTDSTYGYNAKNPLPMKKGSTSKSLTYTYTLLSGLKTQDSQTLKIHERDSYSAPKLKGKRLTLLDRFVLVTSGTKDTVILYTDINKKGRLLLPIGLKYQTTMK